MKLLIFLLTIAASTVGFAENKLPPGHPPLNGQKPQQPAAPAALPQQGIVTEVIDVAQYTYLQVQQGEQSRWLAGPSVAVKKGDSVQFDNGLEMKNFHSNSLDRTFPSIYFVNRIDIGATAK